MIWITAGLALLLLQVPAIIFLEFRQPPKALAWLLVLIMLPLVGLVMYFFMERRYPRRKRKDKNALLADSNEIRAGEFKEEWNEIPKLCPQADRKLLHLLSRFSAPSKMSRYNKIRVLTNGKETFEAILSAIEKAAHHIHLDYYIFREQGIGQRFADLMIQKAKEGVEVRLLYDGIGSHQLSPQFIEHLHSHGVETACFSPPWLAFFAKKINYRNHRKIVIVDGRIGFFGGINVGDEYLGKDPKLGFWRDTHMQIEGEAVYSLQETFMADWHYATDIKLEGADYFPVINQLSTGWTQIVAGGPDGHREVIQASVMACMTAAKHSIRIATPYFIPDRALISTLKLAVLSGVEVTVLIPAIPDSRVIYWASRSYIKELLQAGVGFHYYTKGFLHAKVTLIDDCIGSVGTANMDLRSYFKNFEINALFFDPDVIARLQKDFAEDMASSEQLRYEDFIRRPFTDKVKELVAHVVSPLF